MRKSNKRKKPAQNTGSWLVGIGTLLIGIAAICDVVLKLVIWIYSK